MDQILDEIGVTVGQSVPSVPQSVKRKQGASQDSIVNDQEADAIMAQLLSTNAK